MIGDSYRGPTPLLRMYLAETFGSLYLSSVAITMMASADDGPPSAPLISIPATPTSFFSTPIGRDNAIDVVDGL